MRELGNRRYAGITQLVEYSPSKSDVVGSIPTARSTQTCDGRLGDATSCGCATG